MAKIKRQFVNSGVHLTYSNVRVPDSLKNFGNHRKKSSAATLIIVELLAVVVLLMAFPAIMLFTR